MTTPEYREGLDDLASHYKSVLSLLGEDPEREGLQKTPMRVAKACRCSHVAMSRILTRC